MPEPGKPYRIPPDNPFVNTPGVRPEIWAFGFRNPWKMSFDRTTGDLWVGDVGWELWEMVFKVKRGGNYGWSVMEGPQPVNVEARRGPTPISAADQGAPSLRGRFDHRRLCLSRHASARAGGCLYLWRLSDRNHLGASEPRGRRSPGSASWPGRRCTWSPLARAHDGELYLLDHDRTHQIYRLVPNPASEGYERLSAPAERDRPLHLDPRPSAGPGRGPLLGQRPALVRRCDGRAVAGRPGRRPIGLDNQGIWRFPDGSVLVRPSRSSMSRATPASRRRMETQILHLEAEVWRPYSYVWNDDQTDAVLADPAGRPGRSRSRGAPGGSTRR